jgi:hypothetical protein
MEDCFGSLALDSNMTWQPIETAPKDGSTLLLAVLYAKELSQTQVGEWRERLPGHFDWLQHKTINRFAGEVTHWMSLPEPPIMFDQH